MTRSPNYQHEDAVQRKLSIMAMALRQIAQYGDCLHQDHPSPDEPPCGCPVCVAKTALASEQDWRYISNHANRQASNPREAAIIAAWARYFKAIGSGSPDHKLGQVLGFEEVTMRDWLVATTVVQWLATNVGQCILSEAGYDYNPPKPVVKPSSDDGK